MRVEVEAWRSAGSRGEGASSRSPTRRGRGVGAPPGLRGVRQAGHAVVRRLPGTGRGSMCGASGADPGSRGIPARRLGRRHLRGIGPQRARRLQGRRSPGPGQSVGAAPRDVHRGGGRRSRRGPHVLAPRRTSESHLSGRGRSGPLVARRGARQRRRAAPGLVSVGAAVVAVRRRPGALRAARAERAPRRARSVGALLAGAGSQSGRGVSRIDADVGLSSRPRGRRRHHGCDAGRGGGRSPGCRGRRCRRRLSRRDAASSESDRRRRAGHLT